MDKPELDLTSQVAAIYADVLGLATVAAEDDFFTLNGDSHQAVLLTLELESNFGIEMPVELIGDLGTVRDVAAWIGQQTALRTTPDMP